MSSALTGNKIKDSYQALLKMGTNGSLDPVTPIVISDGLGNDTPLLLSGTEFKTQVVSAAKLYGFWADLSSNSHVAVGDYAGQYNGTFLYVSDFNNVIQANSGGSVKGLSLDYSINNYIFGTSPNGMNVVDGVNKFLTINSNSFPFVDIDGTNNISQFGGQSAKLFSNGKFKGGNKIGIWETYFNNGKISIIAHYDEGVLVSEFKSYAENGKLQFFGNYENGKQVGVWRTYHENGKMQTFGELTEGRQTGIWKIFFDNGQLASEGLYIDSLKVGEWKTYYEDGKIESIKNYEANDEEGECKYYYSNGQLKSIGSFMYGQLVGEWIFYFESGKLKALFNYKEGLLDGEWKEFYENGQIKTIGVYLNGLQEGEWKTYDEKGKIIKVENYKEGEVK